MASLEFDKEVNALYIRLSKGRVSSSEPIADNITIDVDSSGKVVGLELLLPPKLKEDVKKQIASLARH